MAAPENWRIFDRRLLRHRRQRIATEFPQADFLLRDVAARLADRLFDVKRRFRLCLDLGCRTGFIGQHMADMGLDTIVIGSDLCPIFLQNQPYPAVAADEEQLPFKSHSVDLVTSVFALHWVNDLPGVLHQIRHILQPDGLLLAALPGGQTLHELATVLMQAESEVRGGAGPRIAPFVDIRDAGALLQRAGFALPVVDAERITVTYGDPFALLRDLRHMGENNILVKRAGSLNRAVLARAGELYYQQFAGADGRLPASFDILFLTAWAPAPSQPQPLKPGSAQTSLATFLTETPVKEDP